jgi:hypothetical protein
MPASGCYNYPNQAPLNLPAPVCNNGLCVTTVTISSGCFYPNSAGNTFYTTCPMVFCNPSIYQSSLGVYRFGIVLQQCPTGTTWNSAGCSTTNTISPVVVENTFTPTVYPQPPVTTLVAQIQPKLLLDPNAPASAGISNYVNTANDAPAATYNSTSIVSFGSTLATASEQFYGLATQQLDICYGSLSYIFRTYDNLPANYDCTTDPNMIESHTVWDNGMDSGACNSAACFQPLLGDKTFKSLTPGAISTFPACSGLPGCDFASIRAARLMQIFTQPIAQTLTSMTNGIMAQMTVVVGGLNPTVLQSVDETEPEPEQEPVLVQETLAKVFQRGKAGVALMSGSKMQPRQAIPMVQSNPSGTVNSNITSPGLAILADTSSSSSSCSTWAGWCVTNWIITIACVGGVLVILGIWWWWAASHKTTPAKWFPCFPCFGGAPVPSNTTLAGGTHSYETVPTEATL